MDSTICLFILFFATCLSDWDSDSLQSDDATPTLSQTPALSETVKPTPTESETVRLTMTPMRSPQCRVVYADAGEVVVDDFWAYGCQVHNTASGGALYISNSGIIARLTYVQCTQCYVHGPAWHAGCIWAVAKEVYVFQFQGHTCHCEHETFCYLEVKSSVDGAIELNDSWGLVGSGRESSFRIEYRDYDPGHAAVVQLLNTTACSVACASGIWIGTHYALYMHFCKFHQNSPGNVLVIGDAWPIDTFTCLEFVQNSVFAVEPRSGLISVDVSCVFRGCLFLAIQAQNYLVSGPDNCTVRFEQCLFSEHKFETTLGVAIETVNCRVHGEVTFDTSMCELYVTFPPAPASMPASPTETQTPTPTETPTSTPSDWFSFSAVAKLTDWFAQSIVAVETARFSSSTKLLLSTFLGPSQAIQPTQPLESERIVAFDSIVATELFKVSKSFVDSYTAAVTRLALSAIFYRSDEIPVYDAHIGTRALSLSEPFRISRTVADSYAIEATNVLLSGVWPHSASFGYSRNLEVTDLLEESAAFSGSRPMTETNAVSASNSCDRTILFGRTVLPESSTLPISSLLAVSAADWHSESYLMSAEFTATASAIVSLAFPLTLSHPQTAQWKEIPDPTPTQPFAMSPTLAISNLPNPTFAFRRTQSLVDSADPECSHSFGQSGAMLSSSVIVVSSQLEISEQFPVSSTPLLTVVFRPSVRLVRTATIAVSSPLSASSAIPESNDLLSKHFAATATHLPSTVEVFLATHRFRDSLAPAMSRPLIAFSQFAISSRAPNSLPLSSSDQFGGFHGGSQEAPTKPSLVWVGVGIAAGLVLLAAAAILLLLVFRRRRTEIIEQFSDPEMGTGLEAATWTAESSDEFVVYINPVDFTGDEGSDTGFTDGTDEGAGLSGIGLSSAR